MISVFDNSYELTFVSLTCDVMNSCCLHRKLFSALDMGNF